MKFSTFSLPGQNVKRLRSRSSENIVQIVVLFRVRKPQPQILLNLCCTKKFEVYEIQWKIIFTSHSTELIIIRS